MIYLVIFFFPSADPSGILPQNPSADPSAKSFRGKCFDPFRILPQSFRILPESFRDPSGIALDPSADPSTKSFRKSFRKNPSAEIGQQKNSIFSWKFLDPSAESFRKILPRSLSRNQCTFGFFLPRILPQNPSAKSFRKILPRSFRKNRLFFE